MPIVQVWNPPADSARSTRGYKKCISLFLEMQQPVSTFSIDHYSGLVSRLDTSIETWVPFKAYLLHHGGDI